MQRVRIGLTGLAFVFLMVMLAAVFTSRSDDEAPITPNSIEQEMKGEGSGPLAGQEEPLAELGVAPGKAESNSAEPEAEEPGEAPR